MTGIRDNIKGLLGGAPSSWAATTETILVRIS